MTSKRATIVLIALVAGLSPSASPAADSFADAIASAQARSVKIYGAAIGRDPGYATGILISDSGDILTAQGIYLAGERIRVTLPDGSEHMAKVIRRSDELQTAQLKISADTPEFFALDQAPAAQQGDWVLAVSNSYKVAVGDEPLAVNLGIVSRRAPLAAKRGTQDVPYEGDALLIDAITSNPGSPGGAVITAEGRLAGMVGKIAESKRTGARLNYAIPADLLQQFVAGKLVAHTKPAVARDVDLGIRLFTLGGSRSPAFVDRVLPNSPAAKAGLKPDDLILAVAGRRIADIRDYQTAIKSLPGGPIRVDVKRKQQLLQVTLDAGED